MVIFLGDGLWLLKTHSIPLNGYFDMFIYVLIPVPGREDDNRIQWIWEYTIFRPQVTVVGIFKLWDIPHGYSNKGKSMINYGKLFFVSIRPWVPYPPAQAIPPFAQWQKIQLRHNDSPLVMCISSIPRSSETVPRNHGGCRGMNIHIWDHALGVLNTIYYIKCICMCIDIAYNTYIDRYYTFHKGNNAIWWFRTWTWKLPTKQNGCISGNNSGFGVVESQDHCQGAL